MFSIGHYQIVEDVFIGNKTLIYRARHEETGEPYLIKTLRAEYPPLDDIVQLKREYKITQAADYEGVIRIIEQVPYKNGIALIMEDFGGVSLTHLLTERGMDLFLFLRIAVRLSETLGVVHRKKIIHKDIKPDNIIVSREMGQVKITDFGIASLLTSERQEGINLDHLEGTLRYMSPEQTGRINRAIDYRTDMYSLGVTFYEMLVGDVPFLSDDPNELLHSHIAKKPILPVALRSGLPETISDIVMKCLSKNAEDRYQSAFGLQQDLQMCLQMLTNEGEITPFTIGQWDRSDVFHIPEKLYGREEDIRTLQTVHDRVCGGGREMLLVSGFSGIGKSVLVNEIKRTIAQERGFFISGKFDQYKRHVPYDALVQALTGLIHQLLMETEQNIEVWKQRLLRALGPNGAVLTDVLPELELIIGKQPAVPQLPPQETQNRFQMAMQNFLAVFTKKEHPLVLFLDDLQWADLASLNMIEYIMRNTATRHLLFIGTYRTNEVQETDRLLLMVEELILQQVSVSRIELLPLSGEQLTEWILDTFQCEWEQGEKLASLVIEKTGGNPFFIKQFLETLYAEKCIVRDYESGHWQWDLDEIGGMEISDNVVDFMLTKIKQLPKSAQDVLQVASCIGSTFDIRTLDVADGKPLQDTASDIQQAIEDGFILPEGMAYKVLLVIEEAGDEYELPADLNLFFRFVHDRVQQAAYSLMSESTRQDLHLKMGRLLYKRAQREGMEEYIFNLANHLNEAKALITDAEERERLARLNLEAGCRAKASTAYEPALKYFVLGVSMLRGDAWQTQYQLAFDLYMERSISEYLCGNFESADCFFDLLLANAQTPLEKASVYDIKAVLYANQVRYPQAIQYGVEGVRLLGINAPTEASTGALLREVVQLKWRMRNKSMEELAQMPTLTDPRLEMAMKLLLNMSGYAYFIDPKLYMLYNLQILNLSLRHGYTAVTATAFNAYAMLLDIVLGDYEGGYRFGQLSLQGQERFGDDSVLFRNKSYFGFATFILPWKEHGRHSIEHLRKVHQRALEEGDLLYAVYSANLSVHYKMMCGFPIEHTYREAQHYIDFIKRANIGDMMDNFLILHGTLSCLKGSTAGRCSMSDGQFDEEAYVAKLRARPEMRSVYYTNKLRLLYLFDEYEAAYEVALDSDRTIKDYASQLQVPAHYFYYALTMLALYPTKPRDAQKRWMRKIAKIQRKMKKWAKHCPDNFLHKYLLIEAEVARVMGRHQDAMKQYDQAIEAATEQSYLQDAAIGNECTAKFYLGKGRTKVARSYLLEARYGYVKWGAVSKVQDLERKYPLMLVAETRAELPVTLLTSMGDSTYEPIDLMTVVQSTQTISGELVYDTLLEQVVQIVAEQAGADRSCLLVIRDGELVLEAELDRAAERMQVGQGTSYKQCENLPHSLIGRVWESKEEAAYAENGKSVACMPVVNQGRLVALLYLENRTTSRAFTQDRLEVVRLLSAQVAVSIEQAQLFDHQVKLNEAFSKFVPHQFLRFLNKKRITDVRLGDYVQTEMTVLFSHIRSFTDLTATMTPKESFTFLNEYLGRMEPLITENGGFVDKYMRDSIMSLFDKSADDSVRAAVAMLHRLAEYNAERVSRGEPEIEVGLGINSGVLMLGTLGGQNRMDSTVISDAVNLASRIEGLTKAYGVSLLISEHTYSRLQDPEDYCIRIVDRLAVRGKSEAVSIYEVFDADDEDLRYGKLMTKELYERAYECYHSGDVAEAERLFGECLAVNPQDRTVRIYLQRCGERMSREFV